MARLSLEGWEATRTPERCLPAVGRSLRDGPESALRRLDCRHCPLLPDAPHLP